MAYFVYILRCDDGSFYTGSTTDVARRLKEHLAGKGGAYTRTRLPVEIVYREDCSDRSGAQKREAEIKKLTHQDKVFLTQEAQEE